MRLRIKRFVISFSYPSLALVTFIVLFDSEYCYLFCLISVISHEIGHLALMLICGASVAGVDVSAFNITIVEKSRYNLSLKKDIICTLAGPAANILLFIFTIYFLRELSFVNLYIGLFNLLPASSLDGGQIMYMLLLKHFSVKKASFICDLVTIAVAFVLFLSGVTLLFNSAYNFSLLLISVYLVLSVFMKADKYL